MFGFEEKIVSLSCIAPEVKCLRLLPVWGERQATFCSTGILGSRVDDRAVPGAAQLFVSEKQENSGEESSMARQRV